MLKGKFVILREINENDLDEIYAWQNDPETTLYSVSNPYKFMSKEQIYEQYIEKNSSKINMAVCTLKNELIGEISYWIPNQWFPSTVELGIIIGKKMYRNSGYGIEAFVLMGGLIFNNYFINRITFCISEHNFMSKGSLERSCMVREGEIRKERYVDGKYCSSIIFGILRNEFLNFKEEFYKKINYKQE